MHRFLCYLKYKTILYLQVEWRDLMENIGRKFNLIILLLLLVFLLTACQQGEKEYDELIYQLESLEEAYNQLLIETEEWRQLTDSEKEIFLTKIEDFESIEEDPNQDIQEIIEDDDLEGAISLQELLLESEKYDGEFVKISSELRPRVNNVDRKSFSTVLATGFQSWENDNSFTLEVFYNELGNWKELGTMTLDRDAMIRVEGTFHIYGNQYNRGYLEASKISFIN